MYRKEAKPKKKHSSTKNKLKNQQNPKSLAKKSEKKNKK
jgi:hypothetical protein